MTRVHLHRVGPSYLDAHTFRATSELSVSGHYVCDKHVLVTFEFEDIFAMNLHDFNSQNVVFGIAVNSVDGGFEVRLDDCYGLAGTLCAKMLKLSFTPGIPEDSIYRKSLMAAKGEQA